MTDDEPEVIHQSNQDSLLRIARKADRRLSSKFRPLRIALSARRKSNTFALSLGSALHSSVHALIVSLRGVYRPAIHS